jgi:DNA modification methylase
MGEMNYERFLKSKQKAHVDSGFNINESELNPMLFDFQKSIVIRALKAGKYAIFADCGLGKTPMQLEWANRIVIKTKKPVLILCPLAVSGQTIQEGVKFNIKVDRFKNQKQKGIYIINYEQLEHINPDIFGGVVLDESSILKNFTGVYKNMIIDKFVNTPYKLACTATPAPNDLNEVGNHSKFLDVMDSEDMRTRWFIRDEGMNNYRLKKYAQQDFYGWIGTWASVLRMPSDCGFDNDGFILPALNLFEREIKSPKQNNGKLFNDISVNATNFNSELRRTKKERLQLAADLVNSSDENFIVWVKQNEEADLMKELITDAVEVRGNESPEAKEKKLLGFGRNEFRVLITKMKIAQFGLNYQNCNNQVVASLDFSFESLYQAIRRSYRFGQKKEVNVWLIVSDSMQNVKDAISFKQNQFNVMMESIAKITNGKEYKLKSDYMKREEKNEFYHLANGDSVDLIKEIETNSIDLSVFSPPFSTLFTYSDNIRDMGNCVDDDEFFEQTEFLLKELYRVMRPGRIVAVHTKDMAVYKNSSGYSGLWNFSGDYHKAMERAGFRYHSKITIWTDPVLEMQRTKTQRLLYKQVTSDSSYSGIGMPEYVTLFRKWEGNEEDWIPITNITKNNFPLDTWQRWASPVWMDIMRTDVLSGHRDARAEDDEKHICPLQLGVIERIIALWSNEGDVVYDPFAGIGSTIWQAVKMKRYGKGSELKESYYDQSIKNLRNVIALRNQLILI